MRHVRQRVEPLFYGAKDQIFQAFKSSKHSNLHLGCVTVRLERRLYDDFNLAHLLSEQENCGNTKQLKGNLRTPYLVQVSRSLASLLDNNRATNKETKMKTESCLSLQSSESNKHSS